MRFILAALAFNVNGAAPVASRKVQEFVDCFYIGYTVAHFYSLLLYLL